MCGKQRLISTFSSDCCLPRGEALRGLPRGGALRGLPRGEALRGLPRGGALRGLAPYVIS